MNLDVVFQPGGKSLNAFYAGILYKRSRYQRFIAGIVQILVGLLIVGTEIAVLFMKSSSYEYWSGLWCAPCIMLSGAFGMKAHLKQKSRDKLNSYIAAVIAVCPFTVLIFLISGMGLFDELQYNWLSIGVLLNTVKIIEGIMALFCSLAIISKLGRKSDTLLLDAYRENLKARTRKAAEEVSVTLRRQKRSNFGTIASINSVDSLCDQNAFPPIFTTDIHKRELDVELHDFSDCSHKGDFSAISECDSQNIDTPPLQSGEGSPHSTVSMPNSLKQTKTESESESKKSAESKEEISVENNSSNLKSSAKKYEIKSTG